MAIGAAERLTPSGVLAELRACDLAERAASARRLELACLWADLHPQLTDLPFASTAGADLFDEGVAVAADAVAEFAAVHGVATGDGRRLIAAAVQLRDRLPLTWEHVLELRLPAWKAELLAHQTRPLGDPASGWVDAQVGLLGGRLSVRGAKKLVVMARAAFEPDGLPDPADRRWVEVTANTNDLSGSGWVEGQLDVPDALDLEAAIRVIAADLAIHGCTDALAVRRAQALGILARSVLGQPVLPVNAPEDRAVTSSDAQSRVEPGVVAEVSLQPQRSRRARPTEPNDQADFTLDAVQDSQLGLGEGRPVLLYVHLRLDSLLGADPTDLAELGTTGQLVTVDQVRRWCGTAGRVTVRPVIDLNTDRCVRGYHPTDLMKEQIALRDRTCVFPLCDRPARPVKGRRAAQRFGFDADHVIPFDAGGETDTANLAPLCRRHHRLKTHTNWRYQRIGAGEYLWQSPHRAHFLRTTTGTVELSDFEKRRRRRIA